MQLCYGFITCWLGTWLAYCPPHERRTLYVSPPFLNNTAGPAPTTRGAVAWLQATALACEAEEVDVHPAMYVDLAGAGGTSGHAAGSPGGGTQDDTSQPRESRAVTPTPRTNPTRSTSRRTGGTTRVAQCMDTA